MVAVADIEGRKRAAAVRAADWIENGMRVGLGTGSTIRHLLEHIAERRREGHLQNIVGIPTSNQTAVLAHKLEIPLGTLDDYPELDLTIDGADEVDPNLGLIKGLGGALLREKIVAAASSVFVVAVDDAKLVDRLGTRAPLPVEVDPFGVSVHLPFLLRLGAEPVLRLDAAGEIVRTDGGNYIIDCDFPTGIASPEAIQAQLERRPGVLESGLFLDMATAVVVANSEEVRVLSRRTADE
ncbi:MAG TPA: ribose 5-phosphate isomerase A [Longimicrobiaceae bacterium]|nr:ribose 5-phosphate isomerase A [Longimicrobiaceae bacterium]